LLPYPFDLVQALHGLLPSYAGGLVLNGKHLSGASADSGVEKKRVALQLIPDILRQAELFDLGIS
jgi:hypothetical protein